MKKFCRGSVLTHAPAHAHAHAPAPPTSTANPAVRHTAQAYPAPHASSARRYQHSNNSNNSNTNTNTDNPDSPDSSDSDSPLVHKSTAIASIDMRHQPTIIRLRRHVRCEGVHHGRFRECVGVDVGVVKRERVLHEGRHVVCSVVCVAIAYS